MFTPVHKASVFALAMLEKPGDGFVSFCGVLIIASEFCEGIENLVKVFMMHGIGTHQGSLCKSDPQLLRFSFCISFNCSPSNLPIVKVLDFMDWLTRPIKGKQQHIRDQIALGVSLQGIAGLQLQEAFRLQAKKFDPVTNTITIDTEVKNRYRIRRIPVADIVCGLLRRMYPDAPESCFIHSFATFNEYSKAVKRTLNE